MSSPPPSSRPHRLLAILIAPLAGLAGGVGWGYANSDLESRARDAGRDIEPIRQQVVAGGITLAAAFALVMLSLLLALRAWLARADGSRRSSVQWFRVLLLPVLIGVAAWLALGVYPTFRESVVAG